MTATKRKAPQSHDDVLEEIAATLDIPPSLYEEAVQRYQSLGTWLDRPELSLSSFDPAISPQGSFLLGTVIRPLTDADEYDVDLVCRLDAAKSDFTQKQLKEEVGREVKAYAKAHGMNEPPEDRRRCWTLHYADGARFHMDIVPALPDAQRYRMLLEARGYTALAQNDLLTGEAIAITDKTHPNYARLADDWPQSNLLGYAAWFRRRMAAQLRARKAVLAEQMLVASVDEIPDYKVKTPLQRAVQLLKRHRDCMFDAADELRPISIIITTLAAKAYENEETIAAALQSILSRMHLFIEDRGGVAWVVNPVNPAENFADKWAEEPKKRQEFFRWLAQARRDFAHYLMGSRFDAVPVALRESLGARLVNGALAGLLPAAALAAPAIAKHSPSEESVQRAEAAAREVQRAGGTSKPWAG